MVAAAAATRVVAAASPRPASSQVGVFDNQLFVAPHPAIDLRSNRGAVQDTSIYDFATGAWRAGPRLPRHVFMPAGVLHGSMFYLIGGMRQQDSAEWTETVPAAQPRVIIAFTMHRRWHGLVEGGLRLAALFVSPTSDGGRPSSRRRRTAQADVFVLDVSLPRERAVWRMGPELPSPRYGHQVVAHQGRVYVLGGHSHKGAWDTECLNIRLSADGSAWEEVPHRAKIKDGSRRRRDVDGSWAETVATRPADDPRCDTISARAIRC